MSACNQPTDEILLKYVSGSLDPALRMLVDAHLETQPATRARLTAFETLGGLLLADCEPVDLTAGSLDRALARIDRMPAGDADEMPAALPQPQQWRWAGPGTRIAPVTVPGSDMKVFMLKIAPGRAILQHGHAEQEWTVILKGSYRDESGHFPAGSFIEEGSAETHSPVVDSEDECVCLIAMSGPIVASGLGGLVARWLMR